MPLHKCQFCHKVLSRSTKLAEHLRSHTGEKPFQCTLCGVHFARSYDLTKHKELHSNLHRYKCEGKEHGFIWGCGKGFHKKSDLNRHLRRKNAEQCRRRSPRETPTTTEVIDAMTYTVENSASRPAGNTSDSVTKSQSLLPSREAASVLTSTRHDQSAKLLSHPTILGLNSSKDVGYVRPLAPTSAEESFDNRGLVVPTFHEVEEHDDKAHNSKAPGCGDGQSLREVHPNPAGSQSPSSDDLANSPRSATALSCSMDTGELGIAEVSNKKHLSANTRWRRPPMVLIVESVQGSTNPPGFFHSHGCKFGRICYDDVEKIKDLHAFVHAAYDLILLDIDMLRIDALLDCYEMLQALRMQIIWVPGAQFEEFEKFVACSQNKICEVLREPSIGISLSDFLDEYLSHPKEENVDKDKLESSDPSSDSLSESSINP